jgi:hypothetical protein
MDRWPFGVNAAPSASWSGLSRRSTSSVSERYAEDVDARHKGEHDALLDRPRIIQRNAAL